MIIFVFLYLPVTDLWYVAYPEGYANIITCVCLEWASIFIC